MPNVYCVICIFRNIYVFKKERKKERTPPPPSISVLGVESNKTN